MSSEGTDLSNISSRNLRTKLPGVPVQLEVRCEMRPYVLARLLVLVLEPGCALLAEIERASQVIDPAGIGEDVALGMEERPAPGSGAFQRISAFAGRL